MQLPKKLSRWTSDPAANGGFEWASPPSLTPACAPWQAKVANLSSTSTPPKVATVLEPQSWVFLGAQMNDPTQLVS